MIITKLQKSFTKNMWSCDIMDKEFIREFEIGVRYATFRVQDAVHELYRKGVRAILIPEVVYQDLVVHPSIRNSFKQDASVFHKCFKIDGVEFYPVMTDEWQFGKIVFGDKICSQ